MAKKNKIVTSTAGATKATAISRVIALVKRPVVYLPLLVVLGGLVYFGAQEYRAVREKEAFNKLEHTTTSAVDAITQSLGEPLFADEANTCSMEAPQKFSGKKLFCNTTTALYYRIGADSIPTQYASKARASLESSFGITLVDVSNPKKTQSVYYDFGSHILKQFGGISCAMGVEYPAGLRGGADIPRRNFINDNVMAIGIRCDKQVVKPLYPMVDR